MTTLSVPIPANLEEFIKRMVKQGNAANKADVVRRALTKYAEDQAVEEVLRAEQEIKEGKALRGNIRALAKNLR